MTTTMIRVQWTHSLGNINGAVDDFVVQECNLF